MASVHIEIRRIEPADATALRSLRLAALADSPLAFGSTYADEAQRSDAEWSARATAASAGDERVMFLALLDDDIVGLAGGYRNERDPTVVELVSMWTAPDARGLGIGRLLVRAVVGWAVASGSRSVGLWVTRGNAPAHRLYESTGFVESGEYRPLPSDPCAEEIRMHRSAGDRPS